MSYLKLDCHETERATYLKVTPHETFVALLHQAVTSLPDGELPYAIDETILEGEGGLRDHTENMLMAVFGFDYALNCDTDAECGNIAECTPEVREIVRSLINKVFQAGVVHVAEIASKTQT